MSENICNVCGANLIYKDGRWVCPACGAYKEEEISNEEVTLLYNASQKLRLASFDDAEELYADIVKKYPKNSEAHWGLVLSRYGIKYEDDYDGRKLPTCYAATMESFLDDKEYLAALSCAPDAKVKAYYEKQGKIIEKNRIEWYEKASKEPAYDVFLCFKDSDKENNIERTDDSIEVANLYTYLSGKGYRVFFSRETLRDKVAEKYEPYIYNALNTASVMIVYGSKPEYFESVWMKNEWTRFLKRMREGLKVDGSLIVAYDGMNPAELPKVFSGRQCLDARKKTFYGDLEAVVRHITTVQRGFPKLPKLSTSFATLHEHEYTTVEVKPSCISKGYLLHKCACGYKYMDNFKPLVDHDYKLINTVPATCKEKGKKEYSCTMCGVPKVETIPVIPHTFSEWIEKTHPTCTEAGEKIRQCTVCGDIETQSIPPMGHQFGPWSRDEERRIEVRYCLNCGYTETDKASFLKAENKSVQKAVRLENRNQKEKAFEIYKELAENGNSFAQFKMYENAISQSDSYTALSYLMKSSDGGYADAQCELGNLYLNGGLGLSRDVKCAQRLLEQSANQENIKANLALGVMYLKDEHDVPKDYKKASSYLLTAMNAGDAEAPFYFGLLFDVIDYYEKNNEKALLYYRLAEKRGVTWSSMLYNNIAMVYLRQKKLKKAKLYFEKAKSVATPEEIDFVNENLKYYEVQYKDKVNTILAWLPCIIFLLFCIFIIFRIIVK